MRIHCIAIGSAVMQSLALALKKKGDEITGSDVNIPEPVKGRLEKEDLLPQPFGWFPEKITKDLDAIILGMDAKADNPELLRAQQLGIRIYSYPEFLFQQSKEKTRVVIGGSLGKTTITAMILHVLHYQDIAVDYVIGAQLDGIHSMVDLTNENDFIVLEGDEYLSSVLDKRPKFHLYKPNIALLSGIAWDQNKGYPTYENYELQFKKFVDCIVKGGSITFNEEDEALKELVEASENTIRRFPYGTPSHLVSGGTTYLDTPEGPMPIGVLGTHNLSNMEGAKWVCQQMGVDESDFYEAIASFSGT